MNKFETGETNFPKNQKDKTENVNEKFSGKLAEIGLDADPEKYGTVMNAGEIIDIEKIDNKSWMVIYDKEKRIGIRKSEVAITVPERISDRKITFQLDMKPKIEYKHVNLGRKGKKPNLDQYDRSPDAF